MEFKRIWNRKIIMILCIAVAANLILYLNEQLAGRSFSDFRKSTSEYAQMIREYKDWNQEEALEDVRNKYVLVRRGEMAGDESLFLRLREKLTYLNHYKEDIAQIVTNAETLTKYSIFSDPGSFSYNNLLKTGKDFANVRDLTISLDNDSAVQSVTQYFYMYYIAFAVILIVLYGIVKERENGVWEIVHTSKNGRAGLAVRRFLIITVISLITVGLLYFSTVILSVILYGGIQDLHNPVQTLASFNRFPYMMSKFTYMLVNFFASWFMVFTLGVISWMLFTLFRNRNHTLAVICTFLGLEILLYQNISIQSVYSMFRHINVLNLFQISDILRVYLNWGYGKFVMPVKTILLIAALFVLAVTAFITVMRHALMYPAKKTGFFGRLTGNFSRLFQKIFSQFSIGIKEFYKLTFSKKSLWIIVAGIALSIYFASSGKMFFSERMEIQDAMYLEHGGSEYSYIINYVEERTQRYEDAQKALQEASVKFESEEIGMDEYVRAVMELEEARQSMTLVGEFSQKISYLEEIKEEYGIDGYMISDRGYEEIFGKYSTRREFILLTLFVVVIVLILSESISYEYSSGMVYILRSSEKGRLFLFIKKILTALSFVFLFYLIIYGIDLYNMYRFYGMPYLSAPVMSLTFMRDCPLNVTIAEWMFLIMLIKLCVCLAVTGIAVLTSVIFGKNKIKAITPFLLAALIACIFFFGTFGIITQMIIAGICFAVAAAFMFISAYIWCGKG